MATDEKTEHDELAPLANAAADAILANNPKLEAASPLIRFALYGALRDVRRLLSRLIP